MRSLSLLLLAVGSVAQSDEAAAASTATALQRACADAGVANASALLAHARKLHNGDDGRSTKQPAEAAPLYAAIAAANSTSLVSLDDACAAATALGHMYLQGDGVQRDGERAYDLFQRAAAFGAPEAQYALGVLHAAGFNAPKDTPLAMTFFHFAAEGSSAEGGSVGAQLALGYRHLLGVDAPKDCGKALLYYSPVAERVVSSAQRLRGGKLLEKVRLSLDTPLGGGGKRGADDDVIQYYEHSARKGSVDAQLTLAHLNLHGARGLVPDHRAAAAYSHLGHMYAQGMGVEQDNATALEFFRKGAAKGHAPSQNGLGYMYMQGYGVAQSHSKALQLFQKAQFNLGAMHIAGLGAHDKALHHFTLSAHQGHTLALYNLGQMHLNGLGTAASCPAPLQLYASLAEGGYEVAQSNVAFLLDEHYMASPDSQASFDLAYMYTHGLGLPSDVHLAERHYDQAMDASADAYLPVQLALLELRLVAWWQAHTGRSDSPVLAARRLLATAWARGWGIAAGEAAEEGEGATGAGAADLAALWRAAAPEWDTLLLAVLTAALASVLSLRVRQQARQAAAR
ncbi:hypothetical protein EMIHUDRAFT_112149 [Emiliania huxleyi CCMP1516]|uniref:Uncharacterized protein n=2 Tax=Emiliania huxleyi TaxID=2903 RepID=A0A0D3KAM6_EMIH1|nr:hypothetical protein EMIHUDRAFT_112149 [Emiliania huxleyi CCMP1516]EOD32811.1 hypothetical protein EMIHUDRAFT_112149 [Emiliania huxleyi CCMP1516]|eukprot:XP_005785240.1 hypothetical protein EMIHUDRAFT_112149 [Emiliania huxleyi CCMP1516]